MLSGVWLFVTPWTVIRQDPLSMGFSRQEYQCGVLFPSPGALSHPGFKSGCPALAGRFFTIWATREAPKVKGGVRYSILKSTSQSKHANKHRKQILTHSMTLFHSKKSAYFCLLGTLLNKQKYVWAFWSWIAWPRWNVVVIQITEKMHGFSSHALTADVCGMKVGVTASYPSPAVLTPCNRLLDS